MLKLLSKLEDILIGEEKELAKTLMGSMPGRSRSWFLPRFNTRIRYERRSSKATMGRFGGGWNWKLGIESGNVTTIINLLFFYVRIDRYRTKEKFERRLNKYVNRGK